DLQVSFTWVARPCSIAIRLYWLWLPRSRRHASVPIWPTPKRRPSRPSRRQRNPLHPQRPQQHPRHSRPCSASSAIGAPTPLRPAPAPPCPPPRRSAAAASSTSSPPAEKVRDEVSITSGYGSKPNADASVEISGAAYAMSTQAAPEISTLASAFGLKPNADA